MVFMPVPQQKMRKYTKFTSNRTYSIGMKRLSGCDVTILDEIDPVACEPKLGYSVTPAEIQHAIKKMKTEKSPGKNGIPPESYKVLEGLGEGILENIITTFGDEPD
jgi:hypothetical protein